MEEHTQIKSRQAIGSDPEGAQPSPEIETPHNETACDSGPKRGAIQFDSPGPNCCTEGKMEEAHTSGTR
jgi:hypothetical protein